MFFPFLGVSAAAIGLVHLGSLVVTTIYLKALLAVVSAAALLLALGHVWRWHKDNRNGHHS